MKGVTFSKLKSDSKKVVIISGFFVLGLLLFLHFRYEQGQYFVLFCLIV